MQEFATGFLRLGSWSWLPQHSGLSATVTQCHSTNERTRTHLPSLTSHRYNALQSNRGAQLDPANHQAGHTTDRTLRWLYSGKLAPIYKCAAPVSRLASYSAQCCALAAQAAATAWRLAPSEHQVAPHELARQAGRASRAVQLRQVVRGLAL